MTVKERLSPLFARAGLLCSLTLPVGAALADEVPAPDQKKPWHFSLGAGVANFPEYPGSDKDRTRALPIVSLRYGRFFLGGVPGAGSPAGFGAYLYEDETWSVGANLSRDVIRPRKESDDERLRGLGDIDSTTRAGLFATYKIGWVTLRASGLSDIGGNDQGTTLSFDAEATYRPFPQLVLSAGPGVTWADEKHTQKFFGIDAGQAARSNFAQYTAGSGVDAVRFSFGARYEITRQWGLGARITAARLQGDAADSPIVQDKNQNTYAMFVTYRFF